MNINVYNIQKQTELLGPLKRSVLWVQGCMRNCEGCIAKNSHDTAGNLVLSAGVLASWYANEIETEGITISGGEPFLQAEAVAEMINLIKEKRPGYGVIVYTGNNYEELLSRNDSSVKSLLDVTDILIDGEYIQELHDTRFAIGSSNQRILRLTEHYSENDVDKYYNGEKKNNVRISISIDSNSLSMTGVPSKDSLEAWNNIKKNCREK